MMLVGVAHAAPPGPELVAHRGESADAPENTMAAFRLAWQRGDPAIELDVHLSKDGKLIVSHDANTKRVTGVDRVIKDSTVEELRALDAGKWKGERWAGEKLPLLEEVLAALPDGRRCFIEIKIGPEAVPELAKVVRTSGKKPGQLVIISFQADAIAEAKRQLPQLKAYFLAGLKKDAATGAFTPTVESLIQRAESIHADGLDLSFTGPVDPEAVRQMKTAGLGVYAWTVDNPQRAQELIAAGVEGITSNRAAQLRTQLGTQLGK